MVKPAIENTLRFDAVGFGLSKIVGIDAGKIDR